MLSRRTRLRTKSPRDGNRSSRVTRLRNVIPNALFGAKDEANPAAVACFRRRKGRIHSSISSEGVGMIAVAMAQLAREHIGLRHRETRALAGEEGDAGRGIADQRHAPPRPVAHSNLAVPVEIDTS